MIFVAAVGHCRPYQALQIDLSPHAAALEVSIPRHTEVIRPTEHPPPNLLPMRDDGRQ